MGFLVKILGLEKFLHETKENSKETSFAL